MRPSRNILPSDPTPRHYKISITPDFDEFVFNGHVEIHLTAKNPQNSITLNYNELQFLKATLTPAITPPVVYEIPVNAIVLNETEMRATFPIQQTFVGEAILSIDYTGIINDKLAGFYRSKYTVKGRESYLGITQFEAVDARRAVPCWDEPAVKAVFELIITAPSDMMVLSNMPHYKKEVLEEKICWSFEPTPKMSTYLLAWAIGDFECVERKVKKTHKVEKGQSEETLVRVFVPEGKRSKALFALDVACRTLPLYEGFFGSNYILPKADLLAIPDFAAGAMENWGLVTYREVALLCDESSSGIHRQYVAIVIAHELAHQWFGNLVTMEWWKELWLNESFATYMEYWCVDKLFPEWSVFTQFVHDETMRAFELDALRSSHPVEVDVSNAQEIDDIFDAISYSKGGSIVRMAVNFIGEAAFQKGIAAYLKHFSFTNATTKDLWRFLGDAAGKPLAPILEHWTAKQGFPYLTVTSSKDRQCLCVTQKRFLVAGDATPEEDETVWKIPLLCTTCEDGVQRVLVESREVSLSIPHSSWVKVNSEQSSFCRVLYGSEHLLKDLGVAIAAKQLSNIDRLSVISDYHAFARAGYCGTVEAVKLLLSYINEDDYVVWCSISDFEENLRMLMSTQDETGVQALNALCLKLYKGTMEKVSYRQRPDDDHNTIQLRALLFKRLAKADDKETIAQALKMHSERETIPIPADLRETIFSVYLKENGKEALEAVKLLAETSTDAMERIHYLRALASSSVEDVEKDLFQYAVSAKVRSQDSIYVLSSLSINSKTSKTYARELRSMWPELEKILPGIILGRTLKLVENGADATEVTKMMEFWNSLSEKTKAITSRSFQQGVERLRNNTVWVSRDAAAVVDFLKRI